MSDIRFSVIPYEACKKELLHFRNVNRDAIRDEKYFDWRYLSRPSRSNPIIVWAESFSGEKVGSLSLIPHPYLVDGRSFSFGVLGDISVSAVWRGKGIAKRMFGFLAGLEEVKRLKGSIVLPNEEASIPLEKSGWKCIARVERYVKILNVEEIISRRVRPLFLARVLANPLNLLLKINDKASLFHNVKGMEGELIGEFDSRFDELWSRVNKSGVIIGLRDRETLSWRYLRHPLIQYHIFTLVVHSQLAGYIVFHIKEGACYLDDILSLHENEYPCHLLALFGKFLGKKSGLSKVVTRVNHNRFLNPFPKVGFVRRSDYQKVMFYTAPGSSDTPFFLNDHNWFLTAGDKDV